VLCAKINILHLTVDCLLQNFRLVVILGFPNDCKKGIQKAIWLDQEGHVLCAMPEKKSVVLVLVVAAIA
jgi:hypothetical protein